MRPKMDISWGVHGRVRDMAARRKKTTSEMYVLIIERGLADLETEGDA